MAIIVQTNLPEVTAQLEATIARVPVTLTTALARSAEEAKTPLVAEIAAHTPFDPEDTGTHLGATTTADVAADGLTALITARQTKMIYWRRKGIDYPLARILIDGIDEEYPITALGKQNGGADALYWRGAEHPVKRVMHPAMDPNPYPEEGAEAAMPAIVTILRRGGELIAESIAAQMAGGAL